MTTVDYCVTTMDRPHALERLLLSIAAHRPDASVHVADQSESFDWGWHEKLAERLREAGLQERPVVHRLPFDCGISAARNHLVDASPGEYKLSLDDDFLFTERTDIDALVRLLVAHPEAGLVGGCVTSDGKVRHVGTRFERRDATLLQLPHDGVFGEHAGLRIKQTDCIPLFVLMRKDLFSHLRWDPRLKTGGAHFDFFLRLPETPYHVLYTPDIAIDHPRTEAGSSYRQMRARDEFLSQMLAKHGLVRVKTLNGTIFQRLPDGGLTAYCELRQ